MQNFYKSAIIFEIIFKIMETPKYENRVPETPKNTQKTSEKLQKLQESVEQNDILNTIPKEEFVKILETALNIDFYKNLHNASLTKQEFLNFLTNKNNSEILVFLEEISKISADNSIFIKNIKNIIQSAEYRKIILETRTYNVKNPHLEAYNIYISRYGSESISNESLTHQKENILASSDFQEFLKNTKQKFGISENTDLQFLKQMYENKNPEDNFFHSPDFYTNFAFLRKNFESNFNFSLKEIYEILNAYHKHGKVNDNIESHLNAYKRVFETLKNFEIKITKNDAKNILRNALPQEFLEKFEEKLKHFGEYKNIFTKTKIAENFDFQDFMAGYHFSHHHHITEINNTGNYRDIARYTLTKDQKDIYTGQNIISIFEHIDADIKDIIDDNPNISKEKILQDFENFLQKQHPITSEDTFLLVWKNFSKQGFSSEIISHKNNIIENIKLLFPKNNFFIGNNYNHLLEYTKNPSESEKLSKFMETLKSIKNLEVDYIPHLEEFSKNSENTLLMLKNIENLGVKNIKLSKIFLIASQENSKNIFTNPENITKIQNLIKIYRINADFDTLTDYKHNFTNADFNGGRVNFSPTNIDFYISNLLNPSAYNFLTTRHEHISKNLLLNKKQITVKDLVHSINYNHENTGFDLEKYQHWKQKLQEIGFDKTEIKSLFAFYANQVNQNTTGVDLFRYFLIHNEEKAEEILEFMKNFEKNLTTKTAQYGNKSDTLAFITNIFTGKSKYFLGTKEDFFNELATLQKYNIAFENFSELQFYARATSYDKNMREILNSSEFQNFYKNISNVFFGGKTDISSLIFMKELFTHTKQKNPQLFQKMQNGNFDDIRDVLAYVKEKYHINSHHPFFISAAGIFVDNFENTKNLISKLESIGEKVHSNNIHIVSVVGKILHQNPEKSDFFFNKKQLTEYIYKNIYEKQISTRASVEAIDNIEKEIAQTTNQAKKNTLITQREQLRNNATERPQLENTSLLELWNIYIFNEGKKNLDKKILKDMILADSKNTTTEFGGIFTFDYDKNTGIKMDFFTNPSIIQ